MDVFTIVASQQDFDNLIASCDKVIEDLASIETAVDSMLSALLVAYQGEATPIIEDFQKPLKGHVGMLKECYNIMKSYASFARQELQEQDTAMSLMIQKQAARRALEEEIRIFA